MLLKYSANRLFPQPFGLIAQTGRSINAAVGIFIMFIGLTGAVIWWPGIDTWLRGLSFRWKTNPKGLNWTLHSALGFWTFAFFFMWAISGIYLSIPSAFNSAVDFLQPVNASSGAFALEIGCCTGSRKRTSAVLRASR